MFKLPNVCPALRVYVYPFCNGWWQWINAKWHVYQSVKHFFRSRSALVILFNFVLCCGSLTRSAVLCFSHFTPTLWFHLTLIEISALCNENMKVNVDVIVALHCERKTKVDGKRFLVRFNFVNGTKSPTTTKRIVRTFISLFSFTHIYSTHSLSL